METLQARDVGTTSKFSYEQCNDLISNKFRRCANAGKLSDMDHGFPCKPAFVLIDLFPPTGC